jgi:tRNA U34 2-thiouridine synthase MnmA/TrmU
MTETRWERKPKALVLLSGGLDSMLATRLMLKQAVEVEAVHFRTPFSGQNEPFVERFCKELGIKLHKIVLGDEFLEIVVSPKHGHGSQMNPCIDCRILELKKSKELAEKTGAEFLVTGEVLGERPFSQRKDVMLHIEGEAGLEGKVLRPLSAKLLPETEPEKNGYVNREKLHAIKGRRRTPQMTLAKEMGIVEYPNPAGGCLLTEPRFADRLREHLEHEKRLTAFDVELLRIGRHFRVGNTKVIVGRNEEENEKLLSIAKMNSGLSTLEVKDYMGPVTVLVGEADTETIKKAAAITVRYSDAPKDASVALEYDGVDGKKDVEAVAISDDILRQFSV